MNSKTLRSLEGQGSGRRKRPQTPQQLDFNPGTGQHCPVSPQVSLKTVTWIGTKSHANLTHQALAPRSSLHANAQNRYCTGSVTRLKGLREVPVCGPRHVTTNRINYDCRSSHDVFLSGIISQNVFVLPTPNPTC